MDDWQVFILAETGLEEVDQGHPLTLGAAGDCRIVCTHDGSGDRTRRGESGAQVVTAEIFEDLLKRAEEERFVLHNRAADASTGLFAAEILEGFAVRRIRSQALEALV